MTTYLDRDLSPTIIEALKEMLGPGSKRVGSMDRAGLGRTQSLPGYNTLLLYGHPWFGNYPVKLADRLWAITLSLLLS